ncbi:MAG TPA: DUF4386 domain-containing protein [Gemmatimonadaceae bacterium]|nr:DUF4386 domain-containing protein [Gemmatimonadaceae bacterium]
MTHVKTYARIAGVLLLVSFVGGAFGELIVPSALIVSGNAVETANRILAHDSLFRLGFAGYLLEAVCDVALALLFYILLKPVNRNLALFAAFLGLISTAMFAVCEMFFFVGPELLRNPVYLQGFSRAQLDSTLYFFVHIYAAGAGLFMVFYGLASLIRGYLIYRSTYIPRFVGVLLMILGVAFIVKNFTLVLMPAYSWDLLLIPAPVTILVLTAWFLWKGVDVQRWNARVLSMRAITDPSLV